MKLKKLLRSSKTQIGAIALMILFSFSSLITIGNAQIYYLEIKVSTTRLTADSINNVTLTVINDFETIYDLYVGISFPESSQDTSSPNIIGIPSWKFGKVVKGNAIRLSTAIFVPEDAAGNVYTANIDLTYKRLGYTSSTTETHTVGFYAQGWIDIVFYELEADPNPVEPGKPISFSANILNKGNIPARFTNVSLVESDILILQAESYSYLGEMDPNSPAPVSLDALVKAKTKEGNYAVEMVVSYEDNNRTLQTVSRQIQFNVVEIREEAPPQGPLEGILGTFRRILSLGAPQQPSMQPSESAGVPRSFPMFLLLPIIIVLIVIIGVVVYVRRRRSKKDEFEDEFEE